MAFDDSSLFLDALADALADDPRLMLVATSADGSNAVAKVKLHTPDIITMDVHMPEQDGLSAIEQVMATLPTPIVVLTADPNNSESSFCFEALSRGALEIHPKPSLLNQRAARGLCDTLCLLSTIAVVAHASRSRRASRPPHAKPAAGARTSRERTILNVQPQHQGDKPGVVGIAASTGGPSLLVEILSELPRQTPWPLVLVQHLSNGFIDHFVGWLRMQLALEVQKATDGMDLLPGTLVVAPNDYHMEVDARARTRLRRGTGLESHMPAANVLFHSLAKNFGQRAIGVVLTGMGDDGAQGLLAMRKTGAATIAQQGITCAVDGMPAAARHIGAVGTVLPPHLIAAEIKHLLKKAAS